jgi:hypothetical protein
MTDEPTADEKYGRWLDWLRQRLGHEPTEKDIQIARAYNDMAGQLDAFADGD